MNFNSLKRLAAVIPVLALLAGCSSGNTNNATGGTQLNTSAETPVAVAAAPTPTPIPVNPPVEGATGVLTQTEIFGRPAINEGLLITNDFLNAYNSITPAQQGAALQGPVGNEVAAFLTAIGNGPASIQALVAALIPDVMRIDTTITSGYTGGVTFVGAAFTTDIASIPTGGRLVLDDVIDITLKLLLRNPAASDNVNYTTTNIATGHQPLSTTFPYLAPPN